MKIVRLLSFKLNGYISFLFSRILILSSLSGLSGQIVDGWYEPINSVTIDFDDSFVKIHYMAVGDNKTQTDDDLLYYWFYKDEIHVTRGGYSGRLLHDEYTAFYKSYNLKEKGQFYYGLKNGTWYKWYESGMLKEVCNWEKGVQNGNYREYNAEGYLMKDLYFRHGLLHGTAIFNINGTVVKKKFNMGKEIIPKKSKKKQQSDANAEKVEI